MELQDIADMKDYLENRCYCHGEIYSLDGFFFEVFEPWTECHYLAFGERDTVRGVFVLATPPREIAREQIIYIQLSDDEETVESCIRFDATENNKRQVLDFLSGKIDKMSIDEYDAGATQKALDEILGVADAVMVSG